MLNPGFPKLMRLYQDSIIADVLAEILFCRMQFSAYVHRLWEVVHIQKVYEVDFTLLNRTPARQDKFSQFLRDQICVASQKPCTSRV